MQRRHQGGFLLSPVNVLDLGQDDLQGAHEDDPGRLREGAGVVRIGLGGAAEVVAVRLPNCPGCGKSTP